MRLMTHLVSHPLYIPRYLSQSVSTKRTPLDMGVPWFSFAAIDFLEQHLRPEMSVFEYGSGGSTIFFAQRVKEVVSTENHAGWVKQLRQRLDGLGIDNVEIQVRECDTSDMPDFASSEYLHSIPDRQFDVLVVDGADQKQRVRPACFLHAQNFVKPGGIIIVDDSWRYPKLRTASASKRMIEFKSVGPCRPGLTSTDVYFY